jgi:cell division protein FtsQ
MCDKIQFDSSYNVTLGYGDVKVSVGNLTDLDEKLMQLPSVLPSLKGEKGTLDLQNYSSDKKTISFQREQ